MRQWAKIALVSVGVLVVVGLVGLLIQIVAVHTAVPSEGFPDGDVAASRATWIQYLGVSGLFVGFIYSALSYRLSRQGRAVDGLVAAVESLGDRESGTRRAGGVFSVSALLKQGLVSRADVEPLLAAFVRENAAEATREPKVEIQIALAHIGRYDGAQGKRPMRLDLRGVHLEDFNLYGLNLSNCDFRGALLRGTKFTDADLEDSLFNNAVLEDADLRGANLRDVSMERCRISNADFYNARTAGLRHEGTDLSLAKNFPISAIQP